MRNPSAAFATALENAKTQGLIVRKLFYVKATKQDGTPDPWGFSTFDETLQFTVEDGQTGETVMRTYVGIGPQLIIPTIPRVTDYSIQTITIGLPSTNPNVLAMARGDVVRFVKCDLHDAILAKTNRKLVANPELSFSGEIDTSEIDTPAVSTLKGSGGTTGSINLDVVSDFMRSLTLTNPAKSSNAQHLNAYPGDNFNKYANSFTNTQVNWGRASK